MKTLAVATLVVGGVVAIMAVADSVNFDNAPAGQAPAGWTATKTGSGNAKWTIEKDDTVKFKPISGKEDQAGGVVWRLKDANNYYVARANALEDNVTIYDTSNGRRTERKRAS